MNAATTPTDFERILSAKIQRRVLPLLIVAWFVAYIDRFNASFAALQMNHELGLSPATFGFGAGVFFFGYSLFEIPSNMFLVRIGARRWLSRIMISWGVICMAMVLTRGAASFHSLRLLLGIAEAGCFPGMAFYLSQWLPRRARTEALAKLGSVALISGVLGAPIAAGLLALNGVFGVSGWRWLFLFEGAPAVVVGWCVLKFLPERPETATWLSVDERTWLASQVDDGSSRVPILSSLMPVIKDVRYWLWSLVFFCLNFGGTAVRLWRPLILKQVSGQSDTMAALLTAFPSAVGAIAIIYAGRHSTRVDERRWHVAIPMVLCGVGIATIGFAHSTIGVLVAASIASIGSAAQPPLFSTVSTASRGPSNAAGIAFVNSLAGFGAFLGPYLWGYAIDATGSVLVAGALSAALVIVAAPIMLLLREDVVLASPGLGVAATA